MVGAEKMRLAEPARRPEGVDEVLAVRVVVCLFCDHAEVVGDHQDSHAELFLKFGNKFQYLRLYGDVERGGGFVRDQQFRVAAQRHSDHHPLAHATAHLVRVIVETFFWFGNLDQPQHFDCPVAGFPADSF